MNIRFISKIVSFTLSSSLLVNGAKADLPQAVTAQISDEYVMRSWGTSDGLLSNSVSGITQTPDGFLWLATARGLARFDGIQFNCFLRQNVPVLNSDSVTGVFVARDGTLWVGLLRGGIVRLRNGQFQSISSNGFSTPRDSISSFMEDSEGGIWWGFAPDLIACRWFHEKLTKYTPGIESGFATYINVDAKQSIWISTTAGCCVFDGTRFKVIDPSGGNIQHMTPARSGGMWAVRQGKLLRYNGDGSCEKLADMGGYGVNVLFEDRSGSLWIGTSEHGLLRFQNGRFVQVPTSHSSVLTLFEDREENLWVGTDGGGIDRLCRRGFFLRDLQNGLHNESIGTLCEASDGRLWLAGRDGVPVRAVDSSNRSFAVPSNWIPGKVLSTCSDPSGGIWLCGIGCGLKHWEHGIFTQEVLKLSSTALFRDEEDKIWSASIDGCLSYWHAGVTVDLPVKDGLVEARALAEDFSGRMWVGTEGGLVFQRQKDQFVKVLLPGAGPDHPVRFIVPDINDTVWIGAYMGGLYRWRSGKVVQLSSIAGLPTDDLHVMAIEPNGDIWFGTGRGLFQVTRGEVEAAMDEDRPLQAVSFGINDGLPNVDFSYGFRNSVVRTQNGHLWFATYRGALEVDSEKLRSRVQMASVLIEGIQLGAKLFPLDKMSTIQIPPNPNALHVYYTLPEMRSPEKIHYRYRVEGLGNADWVSAGDQRMAVLANLSPGSYRFEVEAALADKWLPDIGEVDFSVEAAWWQTNTFRLGITIIGIVCLVWLVRAVVIRRMREKLRVLEQQHTLERERARIARDMHDELGSSLTYIALLTEVATGELELSSSVAKQLELIAGAARDVSGTLDRIVWTVNPRNDTLARLIGFMAETSREYLEAAEVTLQLSLQAEIPKLIVLSDVRHQIMLGLKEILNNIAKHSRAQSATISITFDKGVLKILVADDGCGFDQDIASISANGLRNINDRMAVIGGRAIVESKLDAGTMILLEIPIST